MSGRPTSRPGPPDTYRHVSALKDVMQVNMELF